jgi:hypothetical protein
MEMSKMSTITIKVKIELEEDIEIEIDDLIHQSIDDYMDYVRNHIQDYVDIDSSFDWEMP